MPNPLTADERERRTVKYLRTLHKGELAEFRLDRMNRVANFRKALKELLERFVEARAEELAAALIEQHAPTRPTSSVVGKTGEEWRPITNRRK